ncbi:MAG: hypothetical protein ACYTG5_16185 [Planctomycetota bacterium]|jgi:hypothetical protein
MNPLLASFAATLLVTAALPQTQKGTILHEPTTGTTLTLPAKTTVVAVDELGAFEQLVAVDGTGIARKDGKPVTFSGLMLRSGDAGALVLGAWKNEMGAKAVGQIMDSLRIERSSEEGGLVLTDTATGATVTVPEGWKTIANRKGLLSVAPERGGMTLILRWAGDFDESVDKAKMVLTGWVFEDIEFSEVGVVEASATGKPLTMAITKSGKAIDIIDEKPVQFSVLRLSQPKMNEGALVFGAWKNETNKQAVHEMLSSIKMGKKKDKMGKKKDKEMKEKKK